MSKTVIDEAAQVVAQVPAGESTVAPKEKVVTKPEDQAPTVDEKGNPIEAAPEPEQAKPEPVAFDHKTANQVEPLIKEAGLDPAEVTKLTIENNGVVPLSVMKSLIEKHGESVAALISERVTGLYESSQAVKAQSEQAIYDQVKEAFKGVTEQTGKETWAELATWAAQNMTVEDRKQVNEMISQGGYAAKLAVGDLVNRFKSSDSVEQNAILVDGDNLSTGGGAPLTRQEYQRELRVLMDKGLPYEGREITELNRRREQSMRRGI